MTDEEQRHNARIELAARLAETLTFAIGTGLSSEASLIAKLIEAALNNTTKALVLKLK